MYYKVFPLLLLYLASLLVGTNSTPPASAPTTADAATTPTVDLTRTICYSGSTLYQKFTQVCQLVDPEYTGTWWCSKITVAERGLSSYRDPIVTKGCAKEEECLGYMIGQELPIPGQESPVPNPNNPGYEPAGMTIKPTCCLNPSLFPSDDAPVNYNLICNSAHARFGSNWAVFSLAVAAVLSLVLGAGIFA